MSKRPTQYTEELGRMVCEAVATSECGLRKTLEQDERLPSYPVALWWIREIPSFAMSYRRAKQEQIEAMAEDIIDISNDNTLDANEKRIKIDTRKWLLSKLIPRTYGDKVDITSGGEAIAAPTGPTIDARIQSIVLNAARRRLEAGADLPDEAQGLLE